MRADVRLRTRARCHHGVVVAIGTVAHELTQSEVFLIPVTVPRSVFKYGAHFLNIN